MHETFEIEWGELHAIEPFLDEVERHAAALAGAYNDPRNAPLLGHTQCLAEHEVVAHYGRLYAEAARPFMLFRGGALVGDGDIRDIADRVGQFAFLISSPDAQGKGLGTRFAVMVHAFAFTQLELERVYASVVPVNVASRRVFEKLGYTTDDSDAARAFADTGDVSVSIDRATFEHRHAGVLGEISIGRR